MTRNLTAAVLSISLIGGIFLVASPASATCPDGTSGPACTSDNWQTLIAHTNRLVSSAISLYVGEGSVRANQTNGGDQLSHVNVGGVQEVTTYGARGSTTSETVTTTSSSTSISLGAAGDFGTNFPVQVNIPHAGATPSVATPTGLSCGLLSYGVPSATTFTGTVENSGCNTGTSNAACTSSYKIDVKATDANGGWSTTEASVTVPSGPTTIGPDYSIRCTVSNITNATATIWEICKDPTNTNPAACKPLPLKIVPTITDNSYTTQTFWYVNSQVNFLDPVFPSDAQLPSSAVNQDLSTTLTALSGTTGTLAVAPGVSSSSLPDGDVFTMYHNDSKAINSAITSMCAMGGTVKIPNASSGAATTYEIGDPISLTTCYGTKVLSDSNSFEAGSGVTLNYAMGAGRNMFIFDRASGDRVSGFNITGVGAPALIASMSNTTSAGSGQLNTKGNSFDNNSIQVVNGGGVAVAQLAAQTLDGEDTKICYNNFIRSAYFGIYFGLGSGTYNENVCGNGIGEGSNAPQFGVWLDNAGSVKLDNDDWESNTFADIYNTGAFGEGQGTVSVRDWVSENAPFVVYQNLSSAASVPSPFLFENGRSADIPGDNGTVAVLAQVSAGSTFINNVWCFGASYQCRIDLGYNTSYNFPTIFIRNTFNKQLSPTGGTGYVATPDLAPIVGDAEYSTGASGYAAIPAYEESGDIVNDTGDGGTVHPIRHVIHGYQTTMDGGMSGGAFASISGGGALSTGSNSFAGTVTGAATTGNVLAPGFTCPNAVVLTLTDNTTAGGAKQTASSATTGTFSATANDSVNYLAGCR